MTTHFTHRFWAALWATLFFLVVAVTAREFTMLGMALPLLVLLAFGALAGSAASISTVSAEFRVRRAIEGDVVVADVRIVADRPVPWLEVEVQAAPELEPLGTLRVITALDAGEALDLPFDFRAHRFGVTGLEWLTVVSRDPLGLTERVLHLPLQPAVRVHPPTERLQQLVPVRQVRSVSGDHRSRQRGEGTELAEVRPYRPGDPARRVHPRLSARRGLPTVLERHPERSADVVVFIDSVQDDGVGLETTLRWTVMAANALADRHLGAMDRVGLLDRGAGVRWLPPSLDRHALHDITEVLLRTAAIAHHQGELAAPPHQLLPAGAAVFAISPLYSDVVCADLTALRRRGHEVMVVVPDDGSVGASLARFSHDARVLLRIERELRRRQLATAGARTVAWNPADPLGAALRHLRTAGR